MTAQFKVSIVALEGHSFLLGSCDPSFGKMTTMTAQWDMGTARENLLGLKVYLGETLTEQTLSEEDIDLVLSDGNECTLTEGWGVITTQAI